MESRWCLPSLVVLLLLCLAQHCSGCSLYATNLKVENMDYPLGVDAPSPRLSWWLLPSDPTCRNLNQIAYRILVASTTDILNKNDGDYWDSSQVNSNDTININYRGKAIPSRTRVYWKVIIWDSNKYSWDNYTADTYGWWETPLLNPEDWEGKWIQRYYTRSEIPSLRNPCSFYKNDPVPLFRKEFALAKKTITQARLYISGLGYYEAFINGQKVGNNVLDPGFTTYNQTILYTTYDVASLLTSTSNNTIGVILGNGWYNPLPMLMFGQNLRTTLSTGFPSTFIAQLIVDYSDGSSYILPTDTTWQVGAGPILFNNIYLGEIYDARLEQEGWSESGFDSSSWPMAVYNSLNQKNTRMVAQYAPPVRMFGPVNEQANWWVDKNTYVVDLGKEFAGWIQLNVTGGMPGQSIFMKYGEILFPNGSVNGLTAVAAQIKSPGDGGPCAPIPAYQTDTFILKGLPLTETYQSMFTWHAFRYVEFTTDAWNSLPTLSVNGIPLHSDLPQIGFFNSSNQLFNDIQQMVVNTVLSNMMSIQSDCPGRERFGYGGDAQASDKMIMYNFDMSNFYRKRVLDYLDSSNYIELTHGFANVMPETAPFVGFNDGSMGNLSGPIGWGTMFPQMQWELYRFTGDTTLLELLFSKTEGWINFLTDYATANSNAIDVGLGDWLALDPPNVNFSSNVFYRYNHYLLAEIAGVLGNTDVQVAHEKIAEEIKNNINANFSSNYTFYDNAGEAAQAFALWHDLVPEQYVQGAFEGLVAAVAEQDFHLSTGLFSIQYMLETLSNMGRSDLAFDIVNQETYPGYGFMLLNNATTVWESWSYSNDTFSHNHPMFGAVSAWFIEYLAGISQSPTSVAFSEIVIQPQVTGNLQWVEGSYSSLRGKISVSWTLEANSTFCVDTTIPPNTAASIVMPFSLRDTTLDPKTATLSESGIPISEIPEMSSHFCPRRFAQVIQVGSGTYHFCVHP